MSKSGLFFTGVVLKNNRNLIQEENARKRLDLLEEQINIQKQNAADRRARERQEGIRKSSAEADFTGISDDRIKSEIINRASNFNNFVANNYDSQDPLVQSEIQSRRDELKLFTEYAKSLDTKITKYDPLNPDAASLRYQTDEEGNNMIELNKANIFQEFQDGTFDLKSRIASFDNDFDGQVIQDETTPGYMADIESMQSESFVGADGNTYKGLPPGSKKDFLNTFERNHLINPNTGTFASTQAEKDYMTNERFSIGGAVLDGIGAYMAEVEGIKNEPKPEMRERFNPNNSELFDEKLHTDYVKYLGEKIWERETANRNTLLARKATGEGGAQEGLSQEDIDFLTGPSTSTLSYGDVQLKFDAGMYDDVTDRNIEVNIVPESLLPGQGELQEFFEKQYKDEVGDTNKSVKAQVSRLGLTTDNVKVASVKFGKKEYLIPYESISSEIQELKKTSVGYKIGQFESESTPQGIDTSIYNTPK
jgi:hypothetical protein|tara:strand:+ start:45 stop:1481 length:1437 start_codon:yes stop_codon:yes gene_type:complete